MTSKWTHPKSDGVVKISYDVGLKDQAAVDLNELLNSAMHSFHVKGRGDWINEDFQHFGNELAKVLLKHRSITNRLFRIGDPPIFHIAKRATELLPALLEEKRRNHKND